MDSCFSYNKVCLNLQFFDLGDSYAFIDDQTCPELEDLTSQEIEIINFNIYRGKANIENQEDLHLIQKETNKLIFRVLEDSKTKSSSNKCSFVIPNKTLPSEYCNPQLYQNFNLSFCSISISSPENYDSRKSQNLNSSHYSISNLSSDSKKIINSRDSFGEKIAIISMLLEGNTTLTPEYYKIKARGKLRTCAIENSFEIEEEEKKVKEEEEEKEEVEEEEDEDEDEEKVKDENDKGITNRIRGIDEIYKKTDNNENDCESLTQNVEINYDDEKINLNQINYSNEHRYYMPYKVKMLGAAAYSSERKIIGLVAKTKNESVNFLSMMDNIFQKSLKEEINRKVPYTDSTYYDEIFNPTIQPELANCPCIEYPFFHYYNYGFSSNQILFYHNLNHILGFKNNDLIIQEGATYTTSPNGFFIIFKNTAFNLNKETIRLNNLIYNHVYHSSVWHKGKLYVISGGKCKDSEYWDTNMNWQQNKYFSHTAKENSAMRSINDSIYLMVDRDENKLYNSVLKFTKDWEVLNWISTWKYERMKLLTFNNSFLLFRGKGESIKNYKFCEAEFKKIGKNKGVSMETVLFSNQSFGVLRNKKYLLSIAVKS